MYINHNYQYCGRSPGLLTRVKVSIISLYVSKLDRIISHIISVIHCFLVGTFKNILDLQKEIFLIKNVSVSVCKEG